MPVPEKREKTWQSMSISNDVVDRLDKHRKKAEKDMGMELSWTKFFEVILNVLDHNEIKLTPTIDAKGRP